MYVRMLFQSNDLLVVMYIYLENSRCCSNFSAAILEMAQIEKTEIMPLSLPNNIGYVEVLKCPWKQGGNYNSQVVANKTCCRSDISMSLTECDTAGEARKSAILLTTVNCPAGPSSMKPCNFTRNYAVYWS